jgi:hypothetical protein
MTTSTTENQVENIIFRYKSTEKTFGISKSSRYENLLTDIKNYFNIPDDSSITFVNADTDRCISTPNIFDLFTSANTPVPKYNLIVRGMIATNEWLFFDQNQSIHLRYFS